jgi:hypothetical protein
MQMIVAAVQPIVINVGENAGLFHWSEATWVSIAALASMLAAAVTAAMAYFTKVLATKTSEVARETHSLGSETRTLAKETRDLVQAGNEERKQVERHHQQAFAPIVVAFARCYLGPSNLMFEGGIQNIGSGPATDIEITVVPMGQAPAAHKNLGSLAAGETRLLKLHWEHGKGEPHVGQVLPYNAILTFKSIFETTGQTIQYSYSGLGEDAVVRQVVLPGSDVKGAEIPEFFPSGRPVPAFGKCESLAIASAMQQQTSEQMRLSIKIVDDLHRTESVNGEWLSPMGAFDRLQQANDKGQIATIRKIQQNYTNETQSNRKFVDDIGGACVVSSNYYNRVVAQLDRGVLDKDYIVRSLGYLAHGLWPILDAIAPVKMNTGAVERMAREATFLGEATPKDEPD